MLRSLLIFALLAGGCHGHSHDDDDQFICDGDEDPCTPGTVVVGDNGRFKLEIVEATPCPQTVDINTLRVKLLDAQDQPVDGATITRIEPITAKHDHGTPVEAAWSAVGSDGLYDLTNVNYVHRGPWFLHIDIDAGGVTDTVTFTFCVEDPNLSDAGS